MTLTLGDYVLGNVVHEDDNEKQYLGVNVHKSTQVCFRYLSQDNLEKNPALQKQLDTEINVMNLAKHPNLLQLVEMLNEKTYMYV